VRGDGELRTAARIESSRRSGAVIVAVLWVWTIAGAGAGGGVQAASSEAGISLLACGAFALQKYGRRVAGWTDGGRTT
jgi:hypothetical protein